MRPTRQSSQFKRWFASLTLAMTALVVSTFPARAEVYLWQDAESKVSLTVPDTWRMGHHQRTDDVLLFWAPGPNDHASCRMRVRDDKRFVIYPQRYSGEVQRVNFSRDFWEGYAGEYDDFSLDTVKDNAGLGRGFASYAEMSYVTALGPRVFKRSIAFVSNYNDRDYILECSAEEHVFEKWRGAFLSVAKSVDFRKSIHEFPAGNYRSFLSDAGVTINNNRPPIDTYHY